MNEENSDNSTLDEQVLERDRQREWQTRLLRTNNSSPRRCLANAMIALRHAPDWAGILAFDSFSLTTMAMMHPPWEPRTSVWEPRPWNPRDDLLLADWLQHHTIQVSAEISQQAVEAVSQDKPFHPVRNYLNSLTWDGKPRVALFGERYLGAGDDLYLQEVCTRFLISAVARIMQPGCQADHIPIFEGSQGIGKSTALRILFGSWFTDELADLGSKDAAMQTRGAWGIEIAELDSMSRPVVSRVKAFISRRTDRFRPPYGRRVIEAPRQCVFAGTTNSDSYLKDETGGRRFWPIKAERIDLDGIARDRDQVWAEAVVRYQAGERWWLEAEATLLAAEQQSRRYIGDPWEGSILAFVEHRSDVSISEILCNALDVKMDRWSQTDQTRVARCLKSFGWERFQKRVPGTRNKKEWRYRCVTSSEDKPSAAE